ncbi:MAG: SsrA-binding protein SmpB [Magnetospirillum sp.]|nr:SsrA-binding protein SmpB [Magnetospirillum sp.]
MPPPQIAAQNRKARHEFTVVEVIEAGIMLVGTEVKSLRAGKATITESYAGPSGDELWLYNAYIPEYQTKMPFPHETRRPRKLLLRRRQLAKLMGAVNKEGMTLIPLDIHFNERGIAKVNLGLAKGKKLHDKREAEKKRDWSREKARLMREKG